MLNRDEKSLEHWVIRVIKRTLAILGITAGLVIFVFGSAWGLAVAIPEYKAEKQQERFDVVLEEALEDGCKLVHIKTSSSRVEQTTYAKFQCEDLVVEWGNQ